MDRTPASFSILIGLCVLAFSATCAAIQGYVNVANTGPRTCSQSSYHSTPVPFCNAANGDTSNNWPTNCIHTVGNTYTDQSGHTQTDYTPWFEVDLGRKVYVNKITVWPRDIYNGLKRLYPFTITVDSRVCKARVFSKDLVNKTLTCTTPIYGQVVRLTKEYTDISGNQFLNLCELEVWVCQDGWWGDQCTETCGSNCEGPCHPKTGYCQECLKEEYYGNTCQSACSEIASSNNRCKTCTKAGVCTRCTGRFKSPGCSECWRGYYGSGCGRECPSKNCKDNRCDPTTGLCTQCDGNFQGESCQDCTEGYHGANCTKLCSGNCQGGCSMATGRCLNCKTGYYGDTCQNDCSSINPGCKTCSRDGVSCAECIYGYQGLKCTDCIDGYYSTGTSCSQCYWRCFEDKCNRYSGRCDGCKTGYHGDQCKAPCTGITSNCENCTQDGACTGCNGNFESPGCTECKDGYYKSGSRCRTCNKSCLKGRCDRESGRCHDCVSGRRGATCLSSCNVNCHTPRCQQDTGKCEGCKTGFHGDQCTDLCTGLFSNCGHCTQDGTCTGCKENFKYPGCTVCMDGFYKANKYPGRSDIKTCRRCTWKCGDNTVCDKTTGHCQSCPDGKKGHYCETDCDSNQYGSRCSLACGHCEGNPQCDPVTGHCPRCQPGWQLPLCQEPCTGKTYGQDCRESCGQCQGGEPCNTVTGNCTGQCASGWTGQLCKTKCKEGRYGEGCDSTCGHCLVNTTCHHQSGFCQQGCAEGFGGQQCMKGEADHGTMGAVIGGVIAVILVAIIVVVIFLIRRRRKASTTTRKGAEDTREMSNVAAAASSVTPPPRPSGQTSAKPTVAVKPMSASSDGASGGIYENVASPTSPTPRPVPTPDRPRPLPTPDRPRRGIAQDSGSPKPPAKLARLKASSSEPSLGGDDEEEFGMAESVYANADAGDNNQPTSIRLDKLRETVQKKLAQGTLEKEMQRLNPRKDFPMTNGKIEENLIKNRFKTIVPFNRNRVVLDQVGGDQYSDYVNASFIVGVLSTKAYIASQGPKTNTFDDFWRMVWQEGVEHIVMLTNLKEGPKSKCSQYWPEPGIQLELEHMEVTSVAEETRAHFLIRTFDLKQAQGQEAARRVTQYHYVSWMDHEVPAVTSLVDFWRHVRGQAPRTASAPPLLVHCSAGVGRTGTYVALDITMDHAQTEAEVDIHTTVDQLRDDRVLMVQNKGQYEFLHEAVLEAYSGRGTRLDVGTVESVLHPEVSHLTPHARVDAEFEVLFKMRPGLGSPPAYTIANLPENRAKNRNPQALPNDKNLVYLTQHAKGRNQYINAVDMATFVRQRGCIMTQLPLPDTVVDLWRLVDGSGVSTVVSIGDVMQEDSVGYWPRKKGYPTKAGPYTVSFVSVAKIEDTLCSYSLQMKKSGGQSREVRLLHLEDWTGEVAGSTADLVQLLTTLHDAQADSDSKPFLVQCIDGAAHSGVVCALYDVISRMSRDSELDVYMAVRQLHAVRPEALTSVVQYRYCYEVAQQLASSFNVYANT